jgi:luciferase-like monooxygenase
LWVAEHSHIPVTRRFTHPQGEAALTRQYYDVMDPFVTLSAAAAVTTRLKLGTAVCLIVQRDTIQTAKSVASSTRSQRAGFYSASAAAGMPKKWKTTVLYTRFAPAKCASRSGR